jgi:hypothetical protein
MMDHSDPMLVLRSLRGNPLTLLVALGYPGQPVTQTWLVHEVGYDPRTTRKYLHYLQRLGYIERLGPQCWQPKWEKLQRLWSLFGIASPRAELDPRRGTDPDSEKVANVGDSPNSPLRTRTCKGNHEVNKKRKSSTELDEKGEHFVVAPELKAALAEAGIKRHGWKSLAQLPHITPDYVRAHHAYVMRHPDPKKRNTGFLIHVLQAGDPAPEFCPDCHGLHGEHTLDCTAQRRRYTSGKYGDLFQH